MSVTAIAKQTSDEVVESAVVVQDVDVERAEIQRLALEAAQAVVAAGHRAPLERDVIKHLAEGDRHHGEIDAAAAHQQHAKQRADDAAEEHAGMTATGVLGTTHLRTKPAP